MSAPAENDWSRRTIDPLEVERNRILKLYCDQDPLLHRSRKNLITWYRKHGRGLGPTGASEILYCLGRLLAKSGN